MSKVKFRHIYNLNREPQATLATTLDKEGDVLMALSICNSTEGDQFNKEMGRTIARGKLNCERRKFVKADDKTIDSLITGARLYCNEEDMKIVFPKIKAMVLDFKQAMLAKYR